MGAKRRAGDEATRSMHQLAQSNPDFEGMQRGMLALLKFIEHSRRQKAISEDSYFEVKGETLKKLAHIKKFLRQSDYQRVQQMYEKAGDYSGEESYDTLESGELVENFIDKVSKPQTAKSRLASLQREREELSEAKSNIEAMLAVLEDGYNEGSISQATYSQLREENEAKLQQITSLLEETQIEHHGAPAPITASRQAPVTYSPRELPKEESFEDINPDFAPAGEEASIQEDFGGDRDLQADEVVAQLGITQKFVEDAAGPAGQGEQPTAAPASPSPSRQSQQALNVLSKIRGAVSKAVTAGEQTVAVAVPRQEPQGQQAPPEQQAQTASPPVLSPPVEKPKEEEFSGETAPLVKYAPEEPKSKESMGSGKMDIELEKLKTKVDSLSEMRDALYERITQVMENVGEVRSMAFTLDSSFKQSEAKSEQVIDLVNSIDPRRYTKELEQRDKVLEEHGLKLEKAEVELEDLARNVSAVRSLLESVGSLRNISEVNKEIGAKSNRMESLLNKAERLNEDLSNTYVDVNKKIEDFNAYRTKQELVVETVKELVTMVDNLNKKLGDYSSKEDARNLQKGIEEVQVGMKEMSAKVVLFQQGRDLPLAAKEIKKRIEGVKLLLATNEEEFASQAISQDEYTKINAENRQKLSELNAQYLKELEGATSSHDAAVEKTEAISQSIKQSVQEPALEPEEGHKQGLGGFASAMGGLVKKVTEAIPKHKVEAKPPMPAVESPLPASSPAASEAVEQDAAPTPKPLPAAGGPAPVQSPKQAQPATAPAGKTDPDKLIAELKGKYLKPAPATPAPSPALPLEATPAQVEAATPAQEKAQAAPITPEPEPTPAIAPLKPPVQLPITKPAPQSLPKELPAAKPSIQLAAPAVAEPAKEKPSMEKALEKELEAEARDMPRLAEALRNSIRGKIIETDSKKLRPLSKRTSTISVPVEHTYDPALVVKSIMSEVNSGPAQGGEAISSKENPQAPSKPMAKASAKPVPKATVGKASKKK